jgi:hypothetical protein
LSIFKEGDCRLQPYQTVTILKQAKDLEYITIEAPTYHVAKPFIKYCAVAI